MASLEEHYFANSLTSTMFCLFDWLLLDYDT